MRFFLCKFDSIVFKLSTYVSSTLLTPFDNILDTYVNIISLGVGMHCNPQLPRKRPKDAVPKLKLKTSHPKSKPVAGKVYFNFDVIKKVS